MTDKIKHKNPEHPDLAADQPSVRLGSRFGLILRGFLFAVCLWSEEPGAQQQWKTYAEAQGLSHNTVFAIAQDRDGAMWFGTEEGANRFDGTWDTFRTAEGLVHNTVNTILQASDGSMWFGTKGGVSRYDGMAWETFTRENTQDGLISNVVNAVYQDRDGILWFGTNLGVSRYDGMSWKTFTKADGLAGHVVNAVFQARDGAMWFGSGDLETKEGGVSRYDGTVWEAFTVETTDGGLASNIVSSLFQSGDGAMWFGTGKARRFELAGFASGRGVSRYDGAVWKTFTGANTGGALGSDDIVQALMQDRDGAMWFGTTGGVSRFDGEKWVRFTREDNPLADNTIFSLLQSSDGAVWIGTGSGVSRYEEVWQGFRRGNTGAGLSDDNVWSIFQSRDGAMWFGTGTLGLGTGGGGISRLDGTVWETFTRENTEGGLVGNTIFSIFQDREGTMWFGAVDNLVRGGISRYDGTIWTTFTNTDVLAGSVVFSIFQDRQENMWFGVGDFFKNASISLYDGTHWQTFSSKNTVGGLRDIDTAVFAVLEDRNGVMWFGTGNLLTGEGSIIRYDGTNWERFTDANTEGGFAGNVVFSITEDRRDGALWFGTGNFHLELPAVNVEDRGGSVSRYDGQTWEIFTEENTAGGLGNNTVFSAFQAQDGAMWFATAGGVSRYDGIWQPFTETDGLAENLVYAVFQDRDASMWFGTGNEGGVSHFKRPLHTLVETEIIGKIPARLGVNRLFIRSQGFEIGSDRQPSLSFALTQGREAPREWDWSSFEFVPGFQLTELDLVNGEWSFYVRALDRFGSIDPTPASVTFTVDLTAPTVLISNPRRDDPVGGVVSIQGAVIDASEIPDLKRFGLDYRKVEPGGEVAQWKEIRSEHIDDPQRFRLENQVLASWDTERLSEPFGAYMLRLWAEDHLGHSSEHQVPITVVSALKDLASQDGGTVEAGTGTVSLKVPPNGFDLDAQVQIAFRPPDELPEPPEGARPTGIAYQVGPEDLVFKKRSTLTIGYKPSDIAGMSESDLAIYTLTGDVWTRLGGTVNTEANQVSLGIQTQGIYALFEAASQGGTDSITDVACQPRIISPGGSLYPGVTDISFVLGSSGHVDVRVYGISGNLIREVGIDVSLNAGLNVLQWDGKNRDGQVVKDGIYLVVVDVDGRSANKTVGVINR